MNYRKNTTIFIVGFVAVLSLLTVLVLADSDYPYGIRTIDYITSSRATPATYAPDSQATAAGNVTEIDLTGISTTKAWAGYYGNISGTLTLEDSAGDVFYNWTTFEPKGEIYASVNTSIDWSTIGCFAFSGWTLTVDDVEAWYGIQDDDEDGINETFNGTDNTAFRVGTIEIAADSCPTTNVYTYGDTAPDGDWENVLLTDNATIIFTTIIENDDVDNNTDKLGFDNREHDFQMLVAENGQDGQEDATTDYYFWAEIE